MCVCVCAVIFSDGKEAGEVCIISRQIMTQQALACNLQFSAVLRRLFFRGGVVSLHHFLGLGQGSASTLQKRGAQVRKTSFAGRWEDALQYASPARPSPVHLLRKVTHGRARTHTLVHKHTLSHTISPLLASAPLPWPRSFFYSSKAFSGTSSLVSLTDEKTLDTPLDPPPFPHLLGGAESGL